MRNPKAREKKMAQVFIGIDIGSVSVKTSVVDEQGAILYNAYVRSGGEPLIRAYELLKQVFREFPREQVAGMAVTGSGGKLLAQILNIPFVNEILAQAIATHHLHPEVRSVIEIGGEDSKLILLEYDRRLNMPVIRDFAMNTICAAGTGSFLDQQASRLGLSIEEFGELALKSKRPPRIAGRCSVFAKTDMIHLQQEATPDYDIVAGLCFALARNFKSTIAKGKKLEKPISFQGGVAANKGMVRAFREILELRDEELIIPRYFANMGAIGCALNQRRDRPSGVHFGDIEDIPRYLETHVEKPRCLSPLEEPRGISDHLWWDRPPLAPGQKLPVYLGIDVGSISTNVVAVDEQRRLVARRYLWTAGRPIDAVRRGLEEIGQEIGNFVEVKGVGTTGSGRYMIGDLVGADVVKNEITAQARAAVEIDPQVDTIFEIGGQDSKYIRLENGAVCDFEMNKVCAAGTGSFLEEQAERLQVNIKEEFGRCALSSCSPIALGERCTVFMESDLLGHQQRGARREDLAAGLAYSIVYNYLNRVVGQKKIGNRIFFQGAVAHNKAVVAAFEKVLGKPITVPPHNDVTGAIGVALLAMEHMKRTGQNQSRFKGFDLSRKKYTIETFECTDCPNRCEIRKVCLEGETPLFYGSRCEKFEVSRRSRKTSFPDLFRERERLLLQSWRRSFKAQGPRIGIPRALLFHELLPFWITFFQELGCQVVLSDRTDKRIIHEGVESAIAEHCFPIKVAHGHVLNLLEKDIDGLFFPSVISLQRENSHIRECYACPFVQAAPHIIRSALGAKAQRVQWILPTLYFKRGRKHVETVLTKVGKTLGKSKREVQRAYEKAERAQRAFYETLRRRGQEILRSLSGKAIVLVGRPYNTCDLELNLTIPQILADRGVPVIPMDFLDLSKVDIGKDWPNMYWRYGQRILSATRIIRQDPRLYPIYITNFGCGPDSFIQRFFSEEMREKPYLIIEVDEHSAPAGVITRCEAFLDSLEGTDSKKIPKKVSPISIATRWDIPLEERTLYIPFMGSHSYALAAALRACGLEAEVMPLADSETLELGRRYTTGKECYPCIITTGDLIRLLRRPDFDRRRAAIFMPESSGPCRFGQYCSLQKLILSNLGLDDIPFVSPNQGSNLYHALKQLGQDLDKRAWLGICAVDILDKLARETRPYERQKGETDRTYAHCLNLICRAVEKGEDVFEVLKEVKRAFGHISVDKHHRKPIIGIVGEIYVRSHPFANDNVVQVVEELGGEAWVAPTAEWLFYLNYRRKEDYWVERNYREFFRYLIKDRWMRWVEHRMHKMFEELLLNREEPTTEEVLHLSDPYLHRRLEGEAVLSVGKALDYIRKGASGIIHVMPFTCMPGTNVSAVMVRIQEDTHIPFLNLAFDGLEQTTSRTRIEAFMLQASQYQRLKTEP